eukprot:11223854-Lingulodinium_polyedra.AAC.1
MEGADCVLARVAVGVRGISAFYGRARRALARRFRRPSAGLASASLCQRGHPLHVCPGGGGPGSLCSRGYRRALLAL